MKTKKIKKLIPLFVLLASFAILSSCNRGVGCPNNFSMGDALTQVVTELPAAIIKSE